MRVAVAEMAVLERQELGAQLEQEIAQVVVLDAGVMRPERAGLRFGDEQPAAKAAVGIAERGGEKQGLVLQPSGLGHDHDIERPVACCLSHLTAPRSCPWLFCR